MHGARRFVLTASNGYLARDGLKRSLERVDRKPLVMDPLHATRGMVDQPKIAFATLFVGGGQYAGNQCATTLEA